jgi:hypothetical protein
MRSGASRRGAPPRSLCAVFCGHDYRAARLGEHGMSIDQMTVLARATPEGEAEYQALVTELRQIWVDLEPIPKQPFLSSGRADLGIWAMGRSPHHPGTGAYRTFRVFGWPLVPLVFLGAYRVCEGPVGNLVFVGRHPLPSWARVWNGVGIPLAAGLGCFWAYVMAQAIMRPLG